jgi:hypothetical protein
MLRLIITKNKRLRIIFRCVQETNADCSVHKFENVRTAHLLFKYREYR